MSKTVPLTGNLVELREMFRRSARFEDPVTAQRLVILTDKLQDAIHDPLHGFHHSLDITHGWNRAALGNIERFLWIIEETAKRAGLEEITLPVRQDSDDARMISRYILNEKLQLKDKIRQGEEPPARPIPRVTFSFFG